MEKIGKHQRKKEPIASSNGKGSINYNSICNSLPLL